MERGVREQSDLPGLPGAPEETDNPSTMNPTLSGNPATPGSSVEPSPPGGPDASHPTAKELAAVAKEQLQTAGEEIKDTAQEAFQAAKDAGEDLLVTQKQQLVEKLQAYKGALQAARGSLEQDEMKLLAVPADRAIRALDRAGTYLSNCDGQRLLHDAATLARRRPEWFFGMLFVAGLAGGRFLKAATPKGPAGHPSRNPSEPAASLPAAVGRTNLTTLP